LDDIESDELKKLLSKKINTKSISSEITFLYMTKLPRPFMFTKKHHLSFFAINRPEFN